MNDIDIGAIRQQVPFIWAHWSEIQNTPQPGLVTDRLICTQQSADDIPTVLRWVEKLTKKVDELTAELAKTREQLTAANRRADGLAADYRSIGRGALIGYRDSCHRAHHRVPGYCICGETWWHGEGCEEYAGLTKAAQAFPAEVTSDDEPIDPQGSGWTQGDNFHADAEKAEAIR